MSSRYRVGVRPGGEWEGTKKGLEEVDSPGGESGLLPLPSWHLDSSPRSSSSPGSPCRQGLEPPRGCYNSATLALEQRSLSLKDPMEARRVWRKGAQRSVSDTADQEGRKVRRRLVLSPENWLEEEPEEKFWIPDSLASHMGLGRAGPDQDRASWERMAALEGDSELLREVLEKLRQHPVLGGKDEDSSLGEETSFEETSEDMVTSDDRCCEEDSPEVSTMASSNSATHRNSVTIFVVGAEES